MIFLYLGQRNGDFPFVEIEDSTVNFSKYFYTKYKRYNNLFYLLIWSATDARSIKNRKK